MAEGGPVIDKKQQFLNALPVSLRQGAVALLASAGGYQLVQFIDQYGPVTAANLYVQAGGAVAALFAALFGWLVAK